MLLATGSLLVIGAALGITADRLLHGREDPRASQLRALQEDPVGTIDRAVRLRPEQRARVHEILLKRQSEIDRAWGDVHAHLQIVLDSVVNEIASVLDAEQAAAFRAHVAQVHGSEPRISH
jgi:hypothetical protein